MQVVRPGRREVVGRGGTGGGRGGGQLVTSAEVKRAQAKEPNRTA